jgi:hypothetical protein
MPTFNQTIEKIGTFKYLESGWHYGEGRAPSDNTLKAALSIVGQANLLGFSAMNAFPGISGEIQVTIYDGDSYYEFTIEPDGRTTVIHEVGREEVFYQEGLSLEQALIKLEDFSFGEDFANDLCNLSELLIPSTMTPTSENSRVSLSRTRVTREYLYSINSAQKAPAELFAPTFPCFT